MKMRILRELSLESWARWAVAVNKAKSASAESAAGDRTQQSMLAGKDEALGRRTALAELEKTVSTCEQCGLCKKRNNAVFGKGSSDGCDVLVIGEAPGEEEDLQGLPFVGKAGRLLDNIFLAFGLGPEKNTYITNIVKCRPPGNRNPHEAEINSCRKYLDRQISLLAPKMILLLGKVAGNALVDSDARVGDMRGKIHKVDGIPTILTYHPAYLLRRPLEKRKTLEDMLFVKRTLEGL